MTKKQLETLEQGQKLYVSYKGVKPCTFKNLKGNMAFIYADLDGQGVRLRRVIATTLLLEDPSKAVKKATKTVKKTEELPSEVEAVLAFVNQGIEMLRKMGYEPELK
jgi:hypothetical protein